MHGKDQPNRIHALSRVSTFVGFLCVVQEQVQSSRDVTATATRHPKRA